MFVPSEQWFASAESLTKTHKKKAPGVLYSLPPVLKGKSPWFSRCHGLIDRLRNAWRYRLRIMSSVYMDKAVTC